MGKISLSRILLYLLTYSVSVHAQISQTPLTALSPNASSLGLYGDIPVSPYTGTPEISIPLYDIRVKDFVLPISLNYHADGVQVDQRGGWTGLNWTLFAGGVITRSVNDVPDDYNNSNYYLGGNSGFYFNYNVLNTASWNQRTYLRSVAQNNQSLKDTAPDEFSFSFAGYNGKFYLDHNCNWVVQCNKPIRISFDGTFLQIPFSKTGTRAENYGYSPCFSGFVITTEDGTMYQFGKNIDAIDFSMNFFRQSFDDWTATAWYLTKIILPSKHEINFTYERNEFINQMYIAVHHDISSQTESKGGIFNTEPACSSWNYNSINSSYEGRLIAPAYLKKISTNNAVISFTKSLSNELKYEQTIYSEKYYDWGGLLSLYPFLPILKSQTYGYPGCLNQLKWYKLDNITIKNKNETETLKTIQFSYNNSSTERLFLDSITESGKNSYLFSYYNRENLPNYLANKSDHWGYFNNTYASLSYANYYNYRNPNASVLKYGILTKIVYPTGGYTEFEFEPHYYRKQLNIERWSPCNTLSSNQLAGGLRIKQIKNSSTPQGPAQVIKEYYYVSDYLQNGTNASTSSGILGGQVQYYFVDYTVYAFNDNNVRRKMSVFSSISVLPSCQNTLGSHIGYTEVIEKNSDNSFTRYQYTNFDNGYLDESSDAIIQQSRTPYEPYASTAKDRGNLLLREDYNTSGMRIRRKSISYEKDMMSNNYVRAMSARYQNVCPGTAVSYDEGTSYKIYTYLLRPQSEVETFYDPGNGSIWQTVTTSYTYTNQKLLRSISLTNSNGVENRTVYKYPFDLLSNSSMATMVNVMNAVSPIVETEQYANSALIKKDYVDYTVTNNVYWPRRFYTQKGIDFKEERIVYSYPDNYGNPTYSLKDDAYKTAYVWGYSGQYLIAKIENIDYLALDLSTISSKPEPAASDWSLINGLRTSLPRSLVTTYTYKPAVGITSATDPRGITTYYEYDIFGRLEFIKDRHGNIIEKYDYHHGH